jgi:hypothetical protein
VLAGFAGEGAEGGQGGGPPQLELFRIDVREATAVRLEGEPPVALLVESWRPGAGVTTVRRD